MMNNVLVIELSPSKRGGGSFISNANFKLDNLPTYFQDIEVKIDTGCSISTIPMRKLNLSEALCKSLKENDIDSGIENIRSYGVETGGKTHSEPTTREQKINCEALKFKHSISNFYIGSMIIPTDHIFENFDRSGNILIGMDILSNMAFHMDVSRKTGNYTLICCPRKNVGKEYFNNLREHFGLVNNV